MNFLYKGNQSYQSDDFQMRKELMERLGNGQTPHTLLLTCSDSRIAVNEFTKTAPGDVFVIRNAGNVIENYNPENPSNEALTLEYGVQALGVKEVVICGHTGCGAMDGIKNLDKLDGLPLVKCGLERISKQFQNDEIKELSLDQLIYENVKKQLLHLYSYPFIKQKVDAKKLNVFGWVYNFVNGTIEKKISLDELLENEGK
jgi:carbonic anhydrase